MAIWDKIMTKITGSPSTEELTTLERCNAIVDGHVRDYAKVGEALMQIRDRRLYRFTHGTFADYISERWKMSDGHANRLIAAAGVAHNLTPMGVIPANERLARPLTVLTPELQTDAWGEALKLAGDDPVRPEHVAAAVSKRSKKKTGKRAKPIRLKVPGCIVIVEPGKGFTTLEQALTDAMLVLTNQLQRRAA